MDSIIKVEVKALRKKMPVYSAEIEVEKDRWIKLFACHLRSSAYSTARRSMSDSASWFDGISLYLKNYKIGKQIRDAEATTLSAHLCLMDSLNVPSIVAGDLNDWSGSACLDSLMCHNLKDAWWEGGFGCGLTYNAWHLKLRLDHILYSPHFELLNVKVENTDFSDHYPLIADFKLKTN
jgi:endonuclease/exonuclease/phosphatase (EEP) superfamily protein YafD